MHTYILIDRSGSMAGKWDDTTGAVNDYIGTLAKNPDTEDSLVTLASFDDHGTFGAADLSRFTLGQSSNGFSVHRRSTPAKECKPFTRQDAMPRGGTPLYDAIGKIMTIAEENNSKRSVIVILTDGYENASRELKKDDARRILDRARERDWQVVFLGAEFDAMTQSADLGTARAQTINVRQRNLSDIMARTATMSANYSVGGQSISYSAEDRTSADA